MSSQDKIVAIGFFTAPEFEQWGAKMRHVYSVRDDHPFRDLLKAIDDAESVQLLNAIRLGNTLD